MKKIKAGVIGLGFIGVAHVEALKRLNFVEVAAVADEGSVGKEKALQLGIENYFPGYELLITDKDIDCVHICTPNYLHYNMVKNALLAGKHVVCEKPLTTTGKEAEELVALARHKGLVNATNFNVRFYPLMHELKHQIAEHQFGDVFSVNGSYFQDWLFHPTDYNWRLEPELSGESRAVADIGSHWMDLAEFVTGLRITEVMADFATFHLVREKPVKPPETYSGKLLSSGEYKKMPISTEDYASLLFRFENGARGSLTVSQVFAGKKNCLTIEVACSAKSASWVSEKPNELWIGNRDSGNELLIKDPSLLSACARQVVSFPGGHNEGFPDTFKQLFLNIYRKIAGLKNEVEFPTFDAGLHEIILCEKILESNRKKMWVTI